MMELCTWVKLQNIIHLLHIVMKVCNNKGRLHLKTRPKVDVDAIRVVRVTSQAFTELLKAGRYCIET